jgi:hypothetical protein
MLPETAALPPPAVSDNWLPEPPAKGCGYAESRHYQNPPTCLVSASSRCRRVTRGAPGESRQRFPSPRKVWRSRRTRASPVKDRATLQPRRLRFPGQAQAPSCRATGRPQSERNRPPAPPSTPSTRLSVQNCRTSRPRLAPEREPQSGFMLPPGVTRRDQIRQIHAADRKNQSDCNHQDHADIQESLECAIIGLEERRPNGAQ